MSFPFLSASQITTYRECARKWAWSYIAGIKTPQHPKAALGDEVDKEQLQPYLRDGRPFDYSKPSGSGYIAAAGLAFLPPPQSPGIQLQKSFEMPSPTWIDGKHVGFGYRGYMDLWLPDSGVVPGFSGGVPFVGDFKTTGNLRWQKTEKQLLEDVQAMLYGFYALYETRAKKIDFSWIYFQTEGARKSKRTNLVGISNIHIAEQFLKINEIGKEMHGVRYGSTPCTNPLDLPPNPDMCEAYGGCAYRDRCNLSPSQIVDAHAAKAKRLIQLQKKPEEPNQMTETTQQMLQRLKDKKAGAQGVPSNGNTAQGSFPANPGNVGSASATAAPLPSSPSVASEPPTPPLGINPPESQLPPAPPVSATKRGRPAKATTPTPVEATGTQVSATFGKEVVQPLPYHSIEVGPFTASTEVRQGESITQALERLNGELAVFASAERTRKLVAFMEMVKK